VYQIGARPVSPTSGTSDAQSLHVMVQWGGVIKCQQDGLQVFGTVA
jgi:hypothetical protein